MSVDGAFKEENRVQVSLRQTFDFKPGTKANAEGVDHGITVRWKGNRGGKWCIVDGEGAAIEKNYENRGEAERRLANILEAKQKG